VLALASSGIGTGASRETRSFYLRRRGGACPGQVLGGTLVSARVRWKSPKPR